MTRQPSNAVDGRDRSLYESKTSIEGPVKLSLNLRSVQLDRNVLNIVFGIAGIPYLYDEKGN